MLEFAAAGGEGAAKATSKRDSEISCYILSVVCRSYLNLSFQDGPGASRPDLLLDGVCHESAVNAASQSLDERWVAKKRSVCRLAQTAVSGFSQIAESKIGSSNTTVQNVSDEAIVTS